MKYKFFALMILALSLVYSASAQPPPSASRAPRAEEHRERHLEWFDRADADKNGTVEHNA
jgi:hypothetical protein